LRRRQAQERARSGRWRRERSAAKHGDNGAATLCSPPDQSPFSPRSKKQWLFCVQFPHSGARPRPVADACAAACLPLVADGRRRWGRFRQRVCSSLGLFGTANCWRRRAADAAHDALTARPARRPPLHACARASAGARWRHEASLAMGLPGCTALPPAHGTHSSSLSMSLASLFGMHHHIAVTDGSTHASSALRQAIRQARPTGVLAFAPPPRNLRDPSPEAAYLRAFG